MSENKKSKAAGKSGALPASMVRAKDEVAKHITTLRVALLFVCLTLCVSIYANVTALQRITVYIPPDLSFGAEMEVGEVGKANVFTNTAYLWIEFNTWMTSGDADAERNTQVYREYFSRSFLSVMRSEYARKRLNGSLDRQRRLTLVPGTMAEAEQRVVPVTANSWVVYLDVVDEEWYLGTRVKNSKVRYSLLVERVETTPNRNAIGMQVVGFKDEPRLLAENG
ncbi:hypothetical protein A6E01_19235 (plasmid) [Vibrio breoganii]|uniref:Uncharacterized protein n=1 Tax=Vibrio breoganii TaxID=553239 RepID=A0AAN0XZL6_9VIBR|nr:DUF2895 family protein [Vibrio breoganii]ANO35349.1 hypothetical protein A6E01_19235 [Vibrio breoganii]